MDILRYVMAKFKKKLSCIHIQIFKKIYLQIERINTDANTELLEINYLFYDGYK